MNAKEKAMMYIDDNKVRLEFEDAFYMIKPSEANLAVDIAIQQAKQEVFDDIEKSITDRDGEFIYFEQFITTGNWNELKQRHLQKPPKEMNER